MSDFRMPSLGADMDFGRVVAWRVKPGERVQRGQVIVEIGTEKGVFEVESPSTGLVGELVVQAGSPKVPVGTLIATIAVDGETVAGPPAVAPPVAAPLAAAPPAGPPPSAAPSAGAPLPPAPPAAALPNALTPPGRLRAAPGARQLAAEHALRLEHVVGSGPEHAITVTDVERALRAPTEQPPAVAPRVSPLARRVAETLGVDAARVRGTGIGGTVTKADVEAAAATAAAAAVAGVAAPPAPAAAPVSAEDGEDAAAMRRAIAAAVSRSKREIPHYYLAADIDLTPALTWLELRNARAPVAERLLPAALLIKAVASSLRRFPRLNGVWTDGAFRPSEAIHVGFAIALRNGGLVVPAIHDTDRRSVDEVMQSLRDLVGRARAGGLRGSEMTDATVTITSLGDEGASAVYGIIYPPQVAVIGFGRITERPWAENGMLAVRRVVTATLAADHRATDGRYGGLFLGELARLLHTPESL